MEYLRWPNTSKGVHIKMILANHETPGLSIHSYAISTLDIPIQMQAPCVGQSMERVFSGNWFHKTLFPCSNMYLKIAVPLNLSVHAYSMTSLYLSIRDWLIIAMTAMRCGTSSRIDILTLSRSQLTELGQADFVRSIYNKTMNHKMHKI